MATLRLQALGLITNPSQIAQVKGAMAGAKNLVSLRPDRLSIRRGFEYAAKLGGKHLKLFPYDQNLVSSFGGNSVSLLTGGVWISYARAVSPWSSSDRVKGIIANGNLYLLGSDGTFRLSTPGGAIERAGGSRGLGVDRSGPAAVLTGASGFLADGSQVAYYVVIGLKDAKGNIHFGEPSSRTIVANSSITSGYAAATARNVVARCLLDDEATTSHFVQLYRTKAVPVGTQPDADPQLVYQDYLTSKNITDGYVDITDTWPEAVPKGAYLYTSQNSGRGVGTIDGENHAPPTALDGCIYKSRFFLFGLVGFPTFQFTIISVGGSAGIAVGDGIKIGNVTYTAVAGAPGANQFTLVTTGASATQNNEQTALNLVEAINRSASNTEVYASYISSPDGVAGRIALEARLPNTTPFSVMLTPGARRLCYEPVLIPLSHTVTLSRAGTTVTATVTAGAQSFRVGERVSINGGAGITNFAGGPFVITAVTGTTFQYTDGSSAAVGPSAAVSADIFGPSTSVYEAASDVAFNAFAYSKPGEFEAFPRRNRGAIGESSLSARRAVALDNSIIVFTSEGLYRITGDDPQTFRVSLIDATCRLVCPESVQKLRGTAIGFTTKGFVQCSDDGWKVISTDIEPTLDSYLRDEPGRTAIEDVGFAVVDEQQGLYEFWLPTTPISTSCEQALVYSAVTGRWTNQEPMSGLTCGVRHDALNALYYGDAYNGAGDSYTWTRRNYGRHSLDSVDSYIVDPVAPTVGTKSIDVIALWQPAVGKGAGTLKKWQQISACFDDALPALCTISSWNEFGDGGSDTIPAQGAAIITTWPRGASQGARLHVQLSSSVDGEDFAIVYVELTFKELSPKVVR